MRSSIPALGASLLLLSACASDTQQTATSAPEPLVELDHVYVIVANPQAAFSALREAGITIDGQLITPHDGAGTASGAAFFENAYLEILWADERVSLADGAAEDIVRFPEAAKWQAGGPSPFGVGLRRTTPGGGPLPYAGKEVEGGQWVEEGQTFFRFDGDPEGVRVFAVPEYMAMGSWKEDFRERTPEIFVHPLAVETLTSVRIDGVAEPASVADVGLRSLAFGDSAAAPLLELTFEDGAAGETVDLRPALPIVIRK